MSFNNSYNNTGNNKDYYDYHVFVYKVSNYKTYFNSGYKAIKACNQNFFRNDSVRSYLSSISHLHYQRKDTCPVCVFYTLETYKQGISDSSIPGEPNLVGHKVYEVPSNYLASDKGFDGLAYLPYQTLLQTTYALCKYVSRLYTKVNTSIASSLYLSI